MEKQDIVIIGGGPAGLSAGIYAARAAFNVTLLEKAMPGGLMANTEYIENYPGFPEGISGPELAMNMHSQATRFGMNYKSEGVESIYSKENGFVIQTDEQTINTSTVIIASGAAPKPLQVEGESEFHGRGVSYCATCDGAFFKDKKVAVIGGGDAAIEEALFLTKFAETVYIVHRRGELRATKYLQEKAFNTPNIEFKWHSVVDKINGSSLVESVTLRDTRDNSNSDLPVNGVFVYIGTTPMSELVKDLIDIDANGYIIADEEMKTSCPGIFVAGDVRQKMLRQVATAVADGAIAAVSAENFINEKK